ncbi:MAG: BamA/TamA family outer membrane protein [Gemmatimonadales bacterium]|nr:BamA/TamA family outer membrane protein [Gemmatimonadales bacterium]
MFRTTHLAWLCLLSPALCRAQEITPGGLQLTGFPALNYNSDEGFGYGVVAGVYRYGAAGQQPYLWSFEPTVFFTTGGRREVSAVADAPFVFGGVGRLTLVVGFERDCCQPYFGLGNASVYDPDLAKLESGPSFYTYARRRWSAVLNLQWRARRNVRILTGFAAHHNAGESRDPNTLFAQDSITGLLPAPQLSAASIGPKVGIVLDSRDHERDPHHGLWAEVLLWQGLRLTGSEHSFTRLTGTVRAYVPLGSSLTVAGRLVGEWVAGTMPMPMLPDIASSFRDFTGLGGDKSIRGVLRNRYLGASRFLANLELRWRGRPFGFLGQRWRLGTLAFVDTGRVWGDTDAAADQGLHWGGGGGLRVTWGETFIIAMDVAHGSEAGLQTYIGLGQLF